jgi:hypothetical protein
MNFKSWLLISEAKKDINLSNPNLTAAIPQLNTSLSNPSLTTTIPPLNASVSNPNLTTKISNRELASNQRVKKLAIEYIKAKGFAKLPKEFKNFLNSKKKAYKDYKKADGTKTTTHKWYPSDIEIARNNGLPDNWMLFADYEKESNQKVKELAIRYKELGTGEYPADYEKESNQKVKALAIRYKELGKYPPEFKDFLNSKRKAYKDYKKADGTKNSDSVWYPSDIEVAEKNGLPNNWMDSQIEIIKSKNEQKSNDRLEELAIYYGKNGASPSKHTSDKKDKSLALWLINKKRNNNPHEKSDDITWAKIVALSKNWNKKKFPYELPYNWRIIKPAGEKSLGEKYVANILTEFGIKNDTEHRDAACKNKICLPFDFSITHNGKKYLEFHGGQHYYPVYFGSTEEKTDQEIATYALKQFEYIKGNDTIKYDHCVKENLPFLVIPYWLDQNSDIIKNIIKQFLETNEFNETFANPNVPSDYKVKHDKIYENFLAKSKPTELVDPKPTTQEPTKTFEQFLINKNFINI